jgi:hypothetical protein
MLALIQTSDLELSRAIQWIVSRKLALPTINTCVMHDNVLFDIAMVNVQLTHASNARTHAANL